MNLEQAILYELEKNPGCKTSLHALHDHTVESGFLKEKPDRLVSSPVCVAELLGYHVFCFR